MESALYDSEYGYYCAPGRKPWGREGDYRTSPDRSVLFAATLGRYFVGLHKQLGNPRSWTIVEAGAGSGDFASVVINALNHSVGTNTFNYVIDDRGDVSRLLANENLQPFSQQLSFEALAKLAPIDVGVIFANELLDAFPVHRVTMSQKKLCEFHVTLGPGGDFEWVIGGLSTPRIAEYFQRHGIELAEGHIAEVNLGVEDWLTTAARKLKRGYLVVVDYGAEAAELYQSDWRRNGTLRSFQKHQLMDDILAQPGERDLTTTIDWTAVRRTIKELGFELVLFERQDKFLLSSGFLEELEMRKAQTQSEAERARLGAEAREMILPSGMAASFQVMVCEKDAR